MNFFSKISHIFRVDFFQRIIAFQNVGYSLNTKSKTIDGKLSKKQMKKIYIKLKIDHFNDREEYQCEINVIIEIFRYYGIWWSTWRTCGRSYDVSRAADVETAVSHARGLQWIYALDSASQLYISGKRVNFWYAFRYALCTRPVWPTYTTDTRSGRLVLSLSPCRSLPPSCSYVVNGNARW